MILVVVPMFQQVYARMGGELPGVTYFIIKLSGIAPVIFIVITILVSLLLFIKHFYGKSEKYLQATAEVQLSFLLPVSF